MRDSEESGIRNQESESRSKMLEKERKKDNRQKSGIRNQEPGIGIPVQNVGEPTHQESGIRNQESGIRIPVKMWAIRQTRNQESGIKWSVKNRKRERRIGRGSRIRNWLWLP